MRRSIGGRSVAAKSGNAPNRGDLVKLDFSPQAGSEQAGWRPAIVVSPTAFNAATGRAFVCPVTSRVRDWPFEVRVDTPDMKGVILVDQLRTIDWDARGCRIVAAAPGDVISAVLDMLNLLFDPREA